MTPRQRAVLLEHVGRPEGVPLSVAGPRARAVESLIKAGMIRGDKPGPRPRRTVITPAGRAEIAPAAPRETWLTSSVALVHEPREVPEAEDLDEAAELAL